MTNIFEIKNPRSLSSMRGFIFLVENYYFIFLTFMKPKGNIRAIIVTTEVIVPIMTWFNMSQIKYPTPDPINSIMPSLK